MRHHTILPKRKTQVVNIYTHQFDAFIGEPHDERDPRTLRVGEHGFLGNPFRDGSPEENLARYEAYFLERVRTDRRFRLAVLSLYGKRLGCYCEGDACHGEIIAEWLEGQRDSYQVWFEAPSRSFRRS